MNLNTNDAHRLLAARIDDCLRQADRGELVCGNFLTPSEVSCAEIILRSRRATDRAFFFGGYEGAERRRIIVLPSYLDDMDGEPYEKATLYFADELGNCIRAVKIKGSGYRVLTHRDYLGSVLSLGIERSSVGDIVVQSDFEAVLFCTDKILGFLLSSLDKIASDKVSAEEYTLPEDFAVPKNVAVIRDTVASKRFDCVIGALTDLSREKAQNLINSGMCEIGHLPEIRVDRQIKENDIISVRGYGKFRIVSFDGETKRHRLRLSAEKYI